MFFIEPLVSLFSGHIILIVAAIVPAYLLLRYIYKADRLEAEPPSMIKSLLINGIVSTFLAVMCERLGSIILGIFFRQPNVLYNLLMYFLVVGLSEEGAKYIMLTRGTWNSPHFNCKFDGVVYAVTVSLGFALWENIEYVLMYGFGTALLRAVTAVPGHACFGVFMGVWYGMAKRCELRGDLQTCEHCKKLCVIMPAFIHGCYDFIASMNTSGSMFIFVGFVAVMFIVSYTVVRRLSKTDNYLDGSIKG